VLEIGEIKMKPFIKKIIDIAEGLDWSVNVDDNELTFSKYSPAGQDFNFCITANSLEEVKDKIKEYCENFDVSEEAYAWLDESGHGTNGAPYDMKDVYEDMEECLDMTNELLDNLRTE
jgi:hypothetical protein